MTTAVQLPADQLPAARASGSARAGAVGLLAVAVASGGLALALAAISRSACLPGWHAPSAQAEVTCARLVAAGDAPLPLALVGFVVPGAASAIVGAFVVMQRRHVIGWLLLLSGVAFTVGPASRAYFIYSSVVAPGEWPRPGVGRWLSFVVFDNPSLFVPFALALLLFPTGRPPSARWRIVVWTLIAAGVTAVVGAAVEPLRGTPFGGTGIGDVLLDVIDAAELIASLLIALCALLAIGGLWRRWRRATAEERLQLRWVGAAAAAVAFLGVVAPAVYVVRWLWPVWPLALVAAAALVPVSIGIAILSSRLYDLDLVVNRAAVYGVLAILVLTLYVVVVTVTAAATQQEGERLASLAVTAAVAVGWQPARTKVERTIDRLLYGRRSEPYAVLAQFGRELERAAEPTEMLQRLVDGVGETLRLPYVAIFSTTGAVSAAASTGVRVEPVESLPLIHRGEIVGRLECGSRRSGVPLSGRDRRLLSDLAGQVSVAVRTAQLVHDLRRSRLRVIEVADEERQRMRRDLHDGLGPALTGIGLAVGELQEQADVEASRAKLDRIQLEVSSCIEDVRRIASDLRPAVLDRHGLAAALHLEAERFSGPDLEVRVDLPAELDALSPAAELAVLRITGEALTNARRHANARICSVRLSIENGIVLEITDDGSGLGTSGSRGVGLQSMSERAQQLGGTCVARTRQEGGTSILVTLPGAVR